VRLERLAEQVRLTPKQLEKQLTAAGVTPPESEDDDEE
jgi:hypothetical protein